METEILILKPPLQKNSRIPRTSLSTFDLPTLIEKLKNSHAWVNGEISSVILMRKSDKQMVLAALHADTEIKSFQSNDSVTFQIIEGKLKFRTRKESITLVKGQLLTLTENISYRLITEVETILLLTILNSVLQPVEV
jgi:quercetin dioxygenase-like cupin family protein